VTMDNEYVPLNPDQPDDDGLKAFIGDYQRRFAAEMDRFVCTATAEFQDDDMRLAQNPLATMICDAMRGATDADVCLFNGGNFRAPIHVGDVTFGDLYAVLPYDNFLMKIPVSGAKLREVLAFAGLQYGDGGFPQISGMRARYVDMELVELLVEADGEFVPVNDDQEYTLLTNDFLAVGGDGFPLSEDPYGPGYTGLEQRATFALWASQQRVLTPPELDGRVIFEWVTLENPGLRD
jgi:2',3'-cyclic-nucleotide 2'-phosphodiesterase (5'-nucleotidase family)